MSPPSMGVSLEDLRRNLDIQFASLPSHRPVAADVFEAVAKIARNPDAISPQYALELIDVLGRVHDPHGELLDAFAYDLARRRRWVLLGAWGYLETHVAACLDVLCARYNGQWVQPYLSHTAPQPICPPTPVARKHLPMF